MTLNGVEVEIGGKTYTLRWQVSCVREFETLHPTMNGAPVAWQTSAFQSSPLFALWHMCIRSGEPKITVSESEALLQAFLDEGHSVEDARDLIGEAGVAGGFLSIVAPDAEVEVEGEASPTTPEDGTTAA